MSIDKPMSCCIVIPNYNHGSSMEQVLESLVPYGLPCLMVDDGSEESTRLILEKLATQYDWVTLLTLSRNIGKGGAVQAGIKQASRKGYSHVIQIDADGQHDLSDFPKFLAEMKKHPEQLISGLPIYDASIPKARLYGRKITDFWVMIETLSRSLKDSMCGFRVYPLAVTIKVMEKYALGQKMDFDMEVMVKLYWEGVETLYIPTKVIYPEQGTSHFKMLQDNLSISWMHTKLFFGMLPRIPSLIKRHKKAKTPETQAKKNNTNEKHWSELNERGSLFAMRAMLFVYRVLGKRCIYWMLYPIVAYFYLVSRISKKASKKYLGILEAYSDQNKDVAKKSFRHFLAFSESAVDKLSVWNNEIQMSHIDFPNHCLFQENVAKKQGGIIFSAHLGNIEIARALSRFEPDVTINALVFNQHAVKFNSLLETLNPECKLNMIEIQDVNIQVAMDLKERVDRGEFIVIMGDRTSTTRPERTIPVNFLGETAYFPEGAFVLGGILKTTVYFMLCIKMDRNHFQVIYEEFADKMKIDRKDRAASLAPYAQKYADKLSGYCQQYPLQWFNFFDIWKVPEALDSKELPSKKLTP